MNSRSLWSRILQVIGGIAMLLGTLDPLEGSVVILAGSGMVALGMFLGGKTHRAVPSWICAFLLTLPLAFVYDVR